MLSRKATKAELSDAIRLQRSRNRQEDGLFIAEGEKVVGELLDSPIKVRQIFFTCEHHPSDVPADVQLLQISEAEMIRLSTQVTPPGILAIGVIPERDHPVLHPKGQIILLLDGISDPGNMGTIIRTAEWFGADFICCSNGSADIWNPKVVQSAMGSVFRLPVYYQDPVSFIKSATSSGIERVIGGVLGGTPACFTEKTEHSLIIVIGGESRGISSELLPYITQKVSIPSFPGAPTESLNAAVACGIMFQLYTAQ